MKTHLKTNEKVVLETQQHWFVLVGPILVLLLGIIIGMVIGSLANIIPLLLLLWFIYRIYQWKNNLWAVTNLRIISEHGVFSQNSKESPLDKINNISYEQPLMGRIFGFGSVQIQTAAEMGITTYSFVQGPKTLKDTITQMQELYRKDQIDQHAKELAHAITNSETKKSDLDISAELEKLFALKQKGILTEEEYDNCKKRFLNL